MSRYLPILFWLPNYSSGWLRSDLVAGLTTAALAIDMAILEGHVGQAQR
jgi:MFS superfamily sulfate permease-like transporter